jgi:hypothetical protein
VIDLQEQRRLLDARVQVALDLLEKAQSGVSLEWRDPAARATLAYVERYAMVARTEIESFIRAVQTLDATLVEEEKNATRTQ